MMELLSNCNLCPRNCNVNRMKDEKGFCGAGRDVKLARVSLHHWEEPCISGTRGSGTVFFSNCTLRCVFCQNHEISQQGIGAEVSINRLSKIFMELQDKGAHNINLVTPTHYVPQIISALKLAKADGLSIPILYNSSGYEKVETIKMLEGCVNVYLPDLKYFNNKYSQRYSKADNYFNFASEAILEMVAQVGAPVFDEDGMITKGVIVRHLMLPGLLFDSKKVIDFLAANLKNNIYLSIMNQYTPMFKAQKYPEINKPLNPLVYESLIDYTVEKGITQGFIQESGTSSEKFVPDFDLRGI